MKHLLVAALALVTAAAAFAQDENDPNNAPAAKKKDPGAGAPPPEPSYGKESFKMRYPASIADPKAALEKLFKKQKGVTDLKIDADAHEITFKFTGMMREAKTLEGACASARVPAHIIDPAFVEFDVKLGKNAKLPELTPSIEGKIHKVLSATGQKVEVTADLETTAWDDVFANSAQKGFTLTGRSHTFATITFSEASDAAEKEAAAFAGVILTKTAEEGKILRLIGEPKLDLAGLAKALKAKGLKIDKTTAGW